MSEEEAAITPANEGEDVVENDNLVSANAQANKEASESERLKREEEESNIARVKFRRPHAKDICSPHSGSILAVDGPVVPLSRELEVAARQAFQNALASSADSSSGCLERNADTLSGLLLSCGFTACGSDTDGLKDLIFKMFFQTSTQRNTDDDTAVVDGKDTQQFSTTMNEDEFCDYVSRFQAPAYYYGERMRRYANRGIIDEMVNILYRGCNPNTADGEGITSMHCAAEFNRIEVMKELARVAGDSLMVDAKDKFGWTPLHSAVHLGNIEAVKVLLEMGANPMVQNNIGKTTIHVAAAQNRKEIVQLLLDAGGNVAQCDRNQFNALHAAALNDYEEMFDLLQKQSKQASNQEDKLGYKPSQLLGSHEMKE